MAIHKVEILLTDDDFNAKGKIKAENLYRYLQEAANRQTKAHNVGLEDLIKKGYMWVLTKMKVKILSDIRPGVKYICGTFPLRQKRVTFKREFFMIEYTDNNNLQEAAERAAALAAAEQDRHFVGNDDYPRIVAAGTSQWCIMDFVTRKMVRADRAGFMLDELAEDFDIIPGPIEKLKGDNLKYMGSHVVAPEDLDKNEHTNNCRYLTMAEEYVDRQGTDIIVNYISETRLGEEIKLYHEKQGSGDFIEGRTGEDDTIVFHALFK
ncbi:MAG: acyl-ACP thioesterase domain-containing protein [Lentihominibacter sp.]|jgi:acyl-ACP thioesterase